MSESTAYSTEPVFDAGRLIDIRVLQNERVWHLAGRGGPEQEEAAALQIKEGVLPVFLGSGLGHGVAKALEAGRGPLAVVDKETPILTLTRTRERLRGREDVLWLDDPDPDAVLKELTRWQAAHGGKPLSPVCGSVYLRLAPHYYGRLNEALKASQSFDFWSKVRYPRFASELPRVLLITSQYFLMGEVVTACQRLGAPHRLIQISEEETGRAEFVEELLQAVVEFKPDFVFTINHLGVDREGVLMDLLERLGLPLASWFVDNPHLILYLYHRLVSDHTAIFTWDADNITSLKDLGFSHVHYLPLATDAQRFTPRTGRDRSPFPPSRISFVGNSMQYKVALRMRAGKFPRPLLLHYKEVARRFGDSDEPSVRRFLSGHFPELAVWFDGLESTERQLAFETMITWEATRQYRKRCVEKILPFDPVIAGDPGWSITFKNTGEPWRLHPEINYYQGLPFFYPVSEINFNCTSKQMKGAVNQRVFDVPAAGAFVLTDWRVQMERLFEPGREVVCYRSCEEIPDLVRFHLAHPAARQRVAQAARRRILSEHTYEHRMRQLFAVMRSIYG